MDNDELIPLDCAAEHLSLFNFPDSMSPEQVLEALETYGTEGGPFPPLYALRRLVTLDYRPRVEYWLRVGWLTTYPTPEGEDKDVEGRLWARCSDLEALMSRPIPWIWECLDEDEQEAAGPVEFIPLDEEYDLGEVEAPAMNLGAHWAEIEERESELIARRNRGDAEPTALKNWFLRDNWTVREGLLILLGLSPEGCIALNSESLGAPRIVSARYLDGSLVSFDDWRVVNVFDDIKRQHGRELRMSESMLTSRPLLDLSYELRDLSAIWDSGDHAPRNPPSYFIAWAGRKDIPLSWLGWARATGLFGHENEATGLGCEMPYTREHSDPFNGMASAVSLPEFMHRLRNHSQWRQHEQHLRVQLLEALQSVGNDESGKNIWLSRFPTSPAPRRPIDLDPMWLAPHISHDAPVLGSGLTVFIPERVWLAREWVLKLLIAAGLMDACDAKEFMSSAQTEPPVNQSPVDDGPSESPRARHAKQVSKQHLDMALGVVEELKRNGKVPEERMGHPGLRSLVMTELNRMGLTLSQAKRAWENYRLSIKETSLPE